MDASFLPPDWPLLVLGKIAQLSPADVEQFAKIRVQEKGRRRFDSLDEERKLVIIALDSLSDDQLRELNEWKDKDLLAKDFDLYIAGLHKVRTSILILQQITGRDIGKTDK